MALAPLLPDSEVTDAQARLREAGIANGDVLAQPIAEARATTLRYQAFLNAGGPEMAETTELVLDGTTPPLRLRLYRPRSAPPGPLPAYLHIHGGGMAVGSLESLDRWKRELADETGFLVVGLDYALAPEHPFPTALHQVLAALRWLRAAPGGNGMVEGTRLAVGGDSAGGNLALSALLHLRAAGEALPALGVLVYGMFSARSDTPSHRERGDGRFGLSTAKLEWFWSQYLPEASLRQNPAAAPLLADLQGLPPLLLQAAALDPLLDDTLDLARRLRDIGARHSLTVYEGVPHGFIGQTALLSKANAARREVAAALKAAFEG
ncbi:alpha/beta hydrolase [Roseomonas sp. GC11]|uniref:alpha/beta hydrolase fold domain-containing protein n=1 Tax=Roseomonas sp. GC11 TaxID=2950546 RepID=UPI00210C57E0|nr:alpha/beta hydrolase [Roseomonas sp. GC11]MCQ4159558.1 alpha/beta hydrolase [Roseomonas sp. GC11]